MLLMYGVFSPHGVKLHPSIQVVPIRHATESTHCRVSYYLIANIIFEEALFILNNGVTTVSSLINNNKNEKMSAQVARPSDSRRQQLSSAADMGEKGVPLVSNFFPLERYYDAADRVSSD